MHLDATLSRDPLPPASTHSGGRRSRNISACMRHACGTYRHNGPRSLADEHAYCIPAYQYIAYSHQNTHVRGRRTESVGGFSACGRGGTAESTASVNHMCRRAISRRILQPMNTSRGRGRIQNRNATMSMAWALRSTNAEHIPSSHAHSITPTLSKAADLKPTPVLVKRLARYAQQCAPPALPVPALLRHI